VPDSPASSLGVPLNWTNIFKLSNNKIASLEIRS